jgi:hypothetical protein
MQIDKEKYAWQLKIFEAVQHSSKIFIEKMKKENRNIVIMRNGVIYNINANDLDKLPPEENEGNKKVIPEE